MRQEHPFHMYDAILKQPETVRTVIVQNEDSIRDVAGRLRQVKRIFLVGIGTSYHAAEISRYIARSVARNTEIHAVHSFEFVHYTPILNKEDCVIGVSHRGTKIFTVEALKIAKNAGCLTIGITGIGDETPLSSYSTVTIRTVEQESSSAHTISFISSVSILAAIFAQIENADAEGIFLRDQLQRVLEESLQVGLNTMELAHHISQGRRIWLVGGGPLGIIAKEIALKIKEASYLQPEGMTVEEMIHGPFQCVESEDFFIVIGPHGKSQKRVLEFVSMIKAIGAKYVFVGDGTASVSSEYQIVVPKVEEHYAALTCLIPLQLLTYQMALIAGTNPDSFRAEDPRFREASARVTL
jgi:glutamine---fructose-6-phosphate transaminase (isomerizing)